MSNLPRLHFVIVTLAVFCIMFYGVSYRISRVAPIWPKILLCGDSITEIGWCEGGWVRLLAERFARKADVVNRGFSGYNVRMLKSILPYFATKKNLEGVVALVIFMGANDSNDPKIYQQAGVPIEEFGQVLSDIINDFVDAGVEKDKIILVSPPPVIPSKWLKKLQSWHGADKMPVSPKTQELTKAFADKCHQVAKHSGVTFIHLFNQMMESKSLSLEDALSDGLHLSKEGNKFLYDLVEPLIHNRTKLLDIMFPDNNQIDNKDTDKSVSQWIQSRVEG